MEINNIKQEIEQKGYLIALTVGVLAILLIGSGAYYFLGKNSSTATTTQASSLTSTDKKANWKTYTNTKAKVSFQYPSDWTIKEDANVEYKSIAIEGKEGRIEIDYGAGFGGACPSGYDDFKVGNAQTKACHSIPTKNDESEKWSLSDMKKNGTDINDINYSGFITVNPPYKENRDVILKIISTFKFTN